MIKAILLTFAVIFASLGVCDVIHTVRSALLLPDVKTEAYCVFKLKSGHGLQQIRFFKEKKRWYGCEFCNRIIVISDELDTVEKSYCENFVTGDDIYICDSESACELLNGFVPVKIEGEENS